MNLNETQNVLSDYPVLVGIDWADEEHAVCLMDTHSRQIRLQTVQNTPASIASFLHKLKDQYSRENLLVCVEDNDTNLKHALRYYGFVDLVEIPTSKLKNFRETFSTSGAKNDPVDAEYLLKLYLHHPGEFEVDHPEDEATRNLDHHARKRRNLVDTRKDLGNTVTSQLKKYFPQALQLTGSSITSKLACDFLIRWPTLEEVKKEDPETLRTFYHNHNVRGNVVEERIQLIDEAVPATEDPVVVQPLRETVVGLVGSMQKLNESIRKFDNVLSEEFQSHPDHRIWDSFPHAGTQMAPRLLAAFGADRDNWEDAEEVQVYGGMAPVTEQSGQGMWVHWRWSAPTFLKQTFYEYAALSIQGSVWARAFYDMKKQQGDDHQTAVRKLAYKWIRIMFRCWKDKAAYSEKKYIKALLKSDSKVPEYIEEDLESLTKEIA